MAGLTVQDKADVAEHMTYRLNLFKYNELCLCLPNVGTNTYLMIQVDPRRNAPSYNGQWLIVEWFFEEDGCRMASCLSTKVGVDENCDPTSDSPFSQRLADGTLLDRCQPACFACRNGAANVTQSLPGKSSQPDSAATVAPSDMAHCIWIESSSVANSEPAAPSLPPLNIEQIVKNSGGGGAKCVIVPAPYVDGLTNPYLLADKRWGVEENGLNLKTDNVFTHANVQPGEQVHFPLGKVHQDHCAFYGNTLLDADPTDHHVPVGVREYYAPSDKECGSTKTEKLVSVFTGNSIIRLCKSKYVTRKGIVSKFDEIMGPKEPASSSAAAATPVTVQAQEKHPSSRKYLSSVEQWKMNVDRNKIYPIPLDIVASDLFSVAELENARAQNRQLIWTNKRAIVERYAGRDAATRVDKYGGVILKGGPQTSKFTLARLENDASRISCGSGVGIIRKPKKNDQIPRRTKLSDQKYTTGADSTSVDENVQILRHLLDQCKGRVREIFEMLGAAILDPEMYGMVAIDGLGHIAMDVLLKKILSGIELMFLRLAKNAVVHGVFSFSSRMMAEAITVSTVNVLLMGISDVIIGAISSAATFVGAALLIFQLLDLIFLLVKDPLGLCKSPDSDAIYRVLASSFVYKSKLDFGTSYIEYDPGMFLFAVKRNNKEFLDAIRYTSFVLCYNFMSYIPVNSAGEEVAHTLDTPTFNIARAFSGPQASVVGATSGFVRAVRQSRAAEMLYTQGNVFQYEAGLSNRSTSAAKLTRAYRSLFLIASIVGLCLHTGLGILLALIVAAVAQTSIFFVLWGNTPNVRQYETKINRML